MIKENKFEELSNLVMEMYPFENSTLNFSMKVKKENLDVEMGIKHIKEFGADLIIISAHGGGFEAVLWFRQDITDEEVYNWLKKSCKGCDIVDIDPQVNIPEEINK
jgi:hypothetical protein